MASLVLTGDTSGQVTIAAPAVAGTNTLTLQAATATNAVNTLATAVASTSGTSIDFTGLPSWIKRITVMFDGVSTSGTSIVGIRLGTSGGIVSTGYAGTAADLVNTGTVVAVANTTLFLLGGGSGSTTASSLRHGSATISLLDSSTNTWVHTGSLSLTGGTAMTANFGGKVALGGTLDRVRITTVNGTDTFDAGSINILYEG
jgi:hypothetical protein